MAAIEALQSAGRFRLVPGRVGAITTEADGLAVWVGAATLPADRVVNATGPSLSPASHPLLAAMVRDGLVAPDPVGLGLAAAGTVAAHVAWRRALARDRFAETAVPLTLWDDAWPWFLLAIPVTATVLAVAFRGRATRVSIGNLSTLAPLMLIVALVSGAHAEARARIAASAAGSVEDLLRPVLGEGARGLALPEMVADEDAQQPVEIALDARGAIVGGAYVAHPGQLSTGRGSVALARAVALAARDGVVTVAVDREVQLDAVRGSRPWPSAKARASCTSSCGAPTVARAWCDSMTDAPTPATSTSPCASRTTGSSSRTRAAIASTSPRGVALRMTAACSCA